MSLAIRDEAICGWLSLPMVYRSASESSSEVGCMGPQPLAASKIEWHAACLDEGCRFLEQLDACGLLSYTERLGSLPFGRALAIGNPTATETLLFPT